MARGSEPNEILQIIFEKAEKKDEKLLKSLQALKIAISDDPSTSHLHKLRRAWTILGRDSKSQQAAMNEAFDADRGFPDYVLVPELPAVEGLGFVILLRAISAMPASELFKSEADARINGKPEAFYRIGRFSDGLRFSISQKHAFLFSRIGMTTTYEDACEVAAELLIESLCQNAGEEK